jgi:hypothetical protein
MSGLLLVGVAACSGEIQDARAPDGQRGRDTVAGGGGAGAGRPVGAGSGAGASCVPGDPRPVTRIARLTHRQYDNTIRDLTGLDLRLAAEFLPDPRQAGFDRGVDLQVGGVLANVYRDAAERVADAVVSDASAYARVIGCDPAQGESCARAFIAGFGKNVLRRPLSAAEQASYLALFERGPMLIESGDDFQRGARVTIEALLQSPKFLYRGELGARASDGRVALSGYEIASRLSYLLVNTTPDSALMAAADAGELDDPDAVADQARRLLAGKAARETVRDFHHQWLDLDLYPNKLTKDAALYPSVGPDLAPVLQQEVERFVDAVTFQRKRGLPSLFSAPFTFVNRTTASLYGLRGTFGDELEEAQLDPTQRAGLLTQLGFLASHAFSQASSPIHRGVFIQRRVLCNAIPDPPPNIPSLPPVDGTRIRTTRQQVDQHTAPAACATCHHTLINPVGFGLEHYDAVGAFRTHENGIIVDASGTLAGTADKPAFADGVELARAVAEAPETRLCYARNWFRYVLGRAESSADECALAQLAERMADDSYTALDALEDLARTPSFLARTEEAP